MPRKVLCHRGGFILVSTAVYILEIAMNEVASFFP